MGQDTDTISGVQFATRLARKLAGPRVLPALLKIQRLNPDTVDSLGRRLEVAAETWPDEVAIRFEGQQWTWQEVNALCNQYAHVLRKRGIRKGDVVAVCVANRPGMLVATTAVLKLGAIAALVNSGLTGDSLRHSLALVDPSMVVVGEEQLDAMQTIDLDATCPDAAILWLPDTGELEAPPGWRDLADEARGAETANLLETRGLTLGDDAIYIYTSGTTGLPKAARTPHARLRMGGLFVGHALMEWTTGDTVYCSLPLYHSTGMMGGWSACVHSGATLAPARQFRASTFWDEIRDHDATAFVYVGELLRYLMNQPPSPRDRDHRIRAIYGAGLRPDLWDDFKKRFGIDRIHEVYGGSETPSGFMNLLNFDRTVGWNPRGWKTVAYDAETGEPVRAPDGRMREVGKGETGVLLFKVDEHQRFEGYTDEAETEKKVLRDVFEAGDVWFNSGDLMKNLGFGHLRFMDRLGDTFRWRGENVATTQVEGVVNAWHQVADSIVYGVRVPGTEGRCGMAWLALADGEALDVEGFAKHLRADLPSFAVPRFVRIGEQPELTGTFRHKKSDLKDESYDLEAVDGPVYLLRPDAEALEPLTPELQADVESGAVRL